MKHKEDIDVLKAFYDKLAIEPDSIPSDIPMYHTDIHYIRAVLNAKHEELTGVRGNYSLEDTLDMLYEEGLITAQEKRRYGPSNARKAKE